MKVIISILLVVSLVGPPAGVKAQGVDDGLVAEWCFDEGSGSVLETFYYFLIMANISSSN